MRKKIVGGIAGGLAMVAAAGAVYVFVVVPGRVDRVIADARRSGNAAHEVAVALDPLRRFDAPATAGVTVFTSIHDARDGVVAFGKAWVATGGGMVLYGQQDGAWKHERTLTWADGLGSADLTAMARWGAQLAVGGADGSVTLIDPDGAQAVRFATGVDGAAVTDLAADGDLLYIATFGGGLITWDGRKAATYTKAAGGESLQEVTALALGTRGVAVGTQTGQVIVQRDGRFVALALGQGGGQASRQAAPQDRPQDRITALAWDGDALWVGRPFGLDRVEADGQVHHVRTDLFVTSILVDQATARVYLGTFDEGLVVLAGAGAAAGGTERRIGGRQRITRVRLVDGRPVAFGQRGVLALSAGDAVPLLEAPPAALAGAHVTALAARHGQTWVGTFEDGVDVFAAEAMGSGPPRLTRHLPKQGAPYGADQVNDLLYRPEAHDTVVATVRGAIRLDEAGAERRIGTRDGLIGEQVQDTASLAGTLAFATNRGVTVLGADGVARSLYALQGLANNHCYAVAWGAGGKLYVGTLGGLSIVTPELTVEQSVGAGEGGFRNAWITALADTPEGMYVGTYGGGVALVTPSGVVDDVSRLLGNGVRVNPGALALAGDRLYVGTLAQGLYVYERSTRRWRTATTPLGSMNVTAIAADGDAVWIGTDRGLVRVSLTALDAGLRDVAAARS